MAQERFIAIGDIHGCHATLEELLNTVEIGARDTVVFLGDYVDRGPDTPGVLARLIAFGRAHEHCVFLRGNHDAMLLHFLGVAEPGFGGESFLLARNRGDTTLRQYGCPAALIEPWLSTPALPDAATRREMLSHIPPEHLAFLEDTRLMLATPEYLFVHAGIRPGIALARQTLEDVLWIREDFIVLPHDLPQTVVYGHTPTNAEGFAIRWDRAGRKIGIDTGCVYHGALTALLLPEGASVSVPCRDAVLERRRA